MRADYHHLRRALFLCDPLHLIEQGASDSFPLAFAGKAEIIDVTRWATWIIHGRRIDEIGNGEALNLAFLLVHQCNHIIPFDQMLKKRELLFPRVSSFVPERRLVLLVLRAFLFGKIDYSWCIG